MTEEARSFHQDNRARSIIGRSAHHKNCTPSDVKLGNKPMSPQEIKKRHGKEETFPSTDCLISYSDFIRYAPDLKVEYVNKMMDKYDIELQHISRYLFNKGDDGLRSYLRNNKLLNLCNYKKARAKTGLLQFQADIEEWKRREKMSREIDEVEAQRKRDIIWNAEFIDYKEFKELPIDGQVAYVNNLIKKYNISISPIAIHLFKIDQGSFREHFKRRNVYDQIEKSKSGNGKTGKARIATFVDAVRNWRGESTIMEEKKEDITEVSIEEEPKTDEIQEGNISTFSIPVEETPSIEVIPEQIATQESIATEEANQHSTVFSANYRAVGMDCDELDALKLMFNNKLVEVCITVRTI